MLRISFILNVLLALLSTANAQFSLDLPYLPPHLDRQAIHLDKLDRTIAPKLGDPDRYTLNGLPFNGHAMADHPDVGQTVYYIIENGFVSQQLSYYRNGQKRAEFNFRAGKSHGLHEIYFPDGKPYIREQYLDGKPHGYFYRWDRAGELVRDDLYRDGELIERRLGGADGC